MSVNKRFLKCGAQTNMVDYLCPENLSIRRLRLLTIGNIISNGCDPETGVFPGIFVEVDVPLGYRQPLYRKFGNVYTAKIK
jgi:hypothetical protein